jgi:hypothetical protein
MGSLGAGHYFTGRGARCLAMTEIKLRRTPHSALSIPHLNGSFPVFSLGLTIGGSGVFDLPGLAGCEILVSMNGATHLKTACLMCALLMVLLAVASGCHKPSTRLEPQIQFLEDLEMNLPTPQDAVPKLIENNWFGRGVDLEILMAEGSRERSVFKTACREYGLYGVMIESDRNEIAQTQKHYQDYVQIGGYEDKDTQRIAADLKKETDEDNAKELREYQNVKDAIKEAIAILEKIQSNE